MGLREVILALATHAQMPIVMAVREMVRYRPVKLSDKD
jgi:hypothetical protein